MKIGSERVRRVLFGFSLWAGSTLISSCAGCEDPQVLAELRQLGDACYLDSDCEPYPLADHPDAKAVCVFGRCHVECETTPDCREFGLGDDIRCITEETPTNVCQLDDEVDCADVVASPPVVLRLCPGDQKCAVDGECRTDCATEDDCLAGQKCVQSSCAEEDELDDDGQLSSSTSCQYTSQCPGLLVCLDHVCAEACLTDEDCGGSSAKCEVVMDTELAVDVHVCVTPTGPDPSLPEHCSNGVKDSDESDVDCGGTCHPCAPGEVCTQSSECTSGSCNDAGVCASPTCTDGVRNGTEADIDCGGTCPSPCAVGTTCTNTTDCTGNLICLDLLCTAPTCGDGLFDGDESDVDCGGSCAQKCDAGSACIIGGDCASLVCTAFSCEAAQCNDHLKNGDETGVDCGGGALTGCAACLPGAPCKVGDDCDSGVCGANLRCASPTCPDGVQNGLETGVDCGGDCATPCAAGSGCNSDADCEPATACEPNTGLCTDLRTLVVTAAGPGTITSNPAGISCPPDCSAAFFDSEPLTLTATPAGPATFQGWSAGPCNGSGICSFAITAPTTVTATFTSPITLCAGGFNYPIVGAFDGVNDFFIGGYENGDFVPPHGTSALLRIPAGYTNSNAFILKYEPGCTVAWARTVANPASASDNFRTTAITTLAAGDPIMILEANGDFVADLLPATCSGPQALGLVRFDGATGTPQYARCFGSGITVTDALTDANDDVVIVGTIAAPTDFGGGVINPASGTDAFIARYDGATGAFMSAKVLGAGHMDAASNLVRAGTGFVVTGTCVGPTTYDAVTTTPPVDSADTDLCAVRLSSSFVAVWAMQEGGPQADAGAVSAVLPTGEIIVGGTFRGDHNFGTGVLSAGASPDGILLLRSGATGAATGSPSLLQIPSTNPNGVVTLTGLVVGPDNRIHVLGFTDQALIGGSPRGNEFLATYQPFGVFETARGGTPANASWGMEMGPAGQVIVIGWHYYAQDPWGTEPVPGQAFSQFIP